jgi:hypothetical protein
LSALDQPCGAARVRAAEQVDVVENVVQVVQIAAPGIAGIERPFRLIGIVKAAVEAAEEFRHGDVGFAVAVVGGGIEDHRRVVSHALESVVFRRP